jgi:uncharacterized protein DUF29
MDHPTLYDDDLYAWSEQQASALRRLAERRELPNDLDLEHVAGEVEDVGRSELNAVQGVIRPIFAHLIKAASTPDASARGRWRAEVVAFHNSLPDRFSTAMAQRLNLDRQWRRALREAQAVWRPKGATSLRVVRPGVPTISPT